MRYTITRTDTGVCHLVIFLGGTVMKCISRERDELIGFVNMLQLRNMSDEIIRTINANFD